MTTDPVVSGVMPLDTSRFPDSCAHEGAAPIARYEEGIREQERCPWLLVAIVVGAVAAALLSVAFPMGFAPLLP